MNTAMADWNDQHRGSPRSSNVEQVKAAHQKQLEAGWRRLGVRLNPEAADDLHRLCAYNTMTPTQVITKLLRDAGKQASGGNALLRS